MDPQDQMRRRGGAVLAVLVLFALSMIGLGTDARGEPAATPLAVDESPALAFDGTNYLVAWTDYESGTGDIYGGPCRSSTGAVLDPGPGIPISTAASQQVVPAVAFDGTNYLVAGEDLNAEHDDVYATRVDPSRALCWIQGEYPSSTAAGCPVVAVPCVRRGKLPRRPGPIAVRVLRPGPLRRPFC